MPIYAYRCASCGHARDVLQKISDPVLTVCPECGAAAFQKQVTAAGFQLKGSGWYVTDFRNNDAKKSSTTKKEGEAAKAEGDAQPAADKPADKPAETSTSTTAAPAPAPATPSP